jgi:hypothetical protein
VSNLDAVVDLIAQRLDPGSDLIVVEWALSVVTGTPDIWIRTGQHVPQKPLQVTAGVRVLQHLG